jgi:hypothetical protein
MLPLNNIQKALALASSYVETYVNLWAGKYGSKVNLTEALPLHFLFLLENILEPILTPKPSLTLESSKIL